jgi:hypothetical protein
VDVLQPGPSDAMFAIVPAIIGVVFVVVLASIVYKAVHLASRGVNPLTVQEDLAARALQSQALQPARTKEQRLDELDELRALGRISEEELQAARARILSE